MGMLDGKVALITGATRGIGRAIARLYASEGAGVAITARHDCPELLAELSALGVKARCYVCDASDFASAHDVAARVVEEFGRLDVLVCNAGMSRDSLMLRLDEQNWDAHINTNLKSAYNYIHAVLPAMSTQRGGSIICMSSIVGERGNPGQTAYAASKAGMIGLVKSLAKEMGPRGIRANCIAPGFILSDMTSSLPEAVIDKWIAEIPMRRGGTVEDVAGVALFLAGDASSYVSGQVIDVSGGWSC